MATRSVDSKRKSAAKVLKPKKSKQSPESELKDQYHLIRDDITKLRDDLAKGYDMARNWIDKNGTLKSFLKAR